MDLKPANLVVNFTWRLVDFEEAALLVNDERLEAAGVPRYVGGQGWYVTWAIASPELAASIVEDTPIEASAAMDVWALGMTLVYIATGRYLYEDITLAKAYKLMQLTPQGLMKDLLNVGCALPSKRFLPTHIHAVLHCCWSSLRCAAYFQRPWLDCGRCEPICPLCRAHVASRPYTARDG